jgi:hypothetical protein
MRDRRSWIRQWSLLANAQDSSFQTQFHLKDASLSKTEQADLLSNITSMVQMGSIGGALIAFLITDKIGRLWATRQLCALWRKLDFTPAAESCTSCG